VDIVLLFTCADHLMWGLWAVVQSKHSKIDFDFKSYSKLRLVNGLQFALARLSDDIKLLIDNNNKELLV